MDNDKEHDVVEPVLSGLRGHKEDEMRVDYMKAYPEGFKAMVGLEEAVRHSTLEPALLELVRTRVSQINGCAYCLGMHNRDARAAGEHQVRLDTLPAWRETPYFNARERAALAWAESLTTISQTRAPEPLFAALEEVFSAEEIAALTFAIVAINGWNRLAIGLESDVTTLDGLDAPDPA
jgi:AhpD family alkylhydroperoxidase